jgi:hypothetical protein
MEPRVANVPVGASEHAGAERSAVEAARVAAPRTAGRLPDFFIIGHEKCGTTALYRILRSHPQVFMPELKEPRYFSRGPEAAEPNPRAVLPKTLEAYLELFAPAQPGQLAGEASPQYIRSAVAAARIAELQPEARAIAILREPVSFLRSFHLACVRSGQETERDLRKALELEQPRRRGQQIPSSCRAPDRLMYSEHVRYVEQLRRFEDALSRERVHVVVYDDLRRENERVAREALRFLGLDETLPIDVSNSSGNQRKAVRSLPLHRLGVALKRARRRPEAAPSILRAIDAITPAWAESLARRTTYAPPPAVDERLANELRARFEPEVAALAAHLDRDLLREWGYRD